MSNAADALPLRLRAVASALVNWRRTRRGLPPTADALDLLPPDLFEAVVDEARIVLDAAASADVIETATGDPGRLRINVAKTVNLDLRAQAVALFDVARDGTVTVSTWAARPGTPSQAIAEWARGLHASAIAAVPFRTVFGWGCGGTPTPLTPEERASLSPAGRAYADRNAMETDP